MPPAPPSPSAGFIATRRRWLGLRWKLLQRALQHSAFRDDELAFLGIAALVGVLASLGVVLLRVTVTMIHTATFGIPIDEHLSVGGVDDWRLVLIVPVVGGLVIGGVAWAIRR